MRPCDLTESEVRYTDATNREFKDLLWLHGIPKTFTSTSRALGYVHPRTILDNMLVVVKVFMARFTLSTAIADLTSGPSFPFLNISNLAAKPLLRPLYHIRVPKPDAVARQPGSQRASPPSLLSTCPHTQNTCAVLPRWPGRAHELNAARWREGGRVWASRRESRVCVRWSLLSLCVCRGHRRRRADEDRKEVPGGRSGCSRRRPVAVHPPSHAYLPRLLARSRSAAPYDKAISAGIEYQLTLGRATVALKLNKPQA